MEEGKDGADPSAKRAIRFRNERESSDLFQDAVIMVDDAKFMSAMRRMLTHILGTVSNGREVQVSVSRSRRRGSIGRKGRDSTLGPCGGGYWICPHRMSPRNSDSADVSDDNRGPTAASAGLGCGCVRVGPGGCGGGACGTCVLWPGPRIQINSCDEGEHGKSPGQDGGRGAEADVNLGEDELLLSVSNCSCSPSCHGMEVSRGHGGRGETCMGYYCMCSHRPAALCVLPDGSLGRQIAGCGGQTALRGYSGTGTAR